MSIRRLMLYTLAVIAGILGAGACLWLALIALAQVIMPAAPS